MKPARDTRINSSQAPIGSRISSSVLEQNENEDPDRFAEVLGSVTAVLARAPVGAPKVIRHESEFERLMPRLLARTRRLFLSHARVFPPEGGRSDRPRLTDGGAFPPPNPEEGR